MQGDANISGKIYGDASDALIRALGGIAARSLATRAGQVRNAADFGMIADGNSHTVQSVFGSLAAAQVRYPHALSADDEIDLLAIQAAVNAASRSTVASEEALGQVVISPNCKPVINRGINLTIPIIMESYSMIHYNKPTGTALAIGMTPPLQNGFQNTGYKLSFAGFRALVGNTATRPTSINNNGNTGITIQSMQFSSANFGVVIGFDKYGAFFDTRAVNWDMVSEPGIDRKGPNVQQNTIQFTLLAYCGIGLATASKDGWHSVGANHISWNDMAGNFLNGMIDGTFDGVEYTASTSNVMEGLLEIVTDEAKDNFIINGSYNKLSLMFLEGRVALGEKAYGCKVITDNNPASKAIVVDRSPYRTNKIEQGHPGRDWNDPGYPQNYTVVGGQPGQDFYNEWGSTVTVSIWVELSPDVSNDAFAQVYTGANPSVYTPYTRVVAYKGGSKIGVPVIITLPMGHFCRVDTSRANIANGKVTPTN